MTASARARHRPAGNILSTESRNIFTSFRKKNDRIGTRISQGVKVAETKQKTPLIAAVIVSPRAVILLRNIGLDLVRDLKAVEPLVNVGRPLLERRCRMPEC